MTTRTPMAEQPEESGRSVAALHLYGRLRDDVLAGVFAAGELLQETTLAPRYGVSRTPVRESLARLEQDGLLERAARGYRVSSGTQQDVLDIYDARIALETVAVSSAATRATDVDLARLGNLHAAAHAAGGVTERRRAHARWHEGVWDAAHNSTVRALLVRLTAQLRIYDQPGVETTSDLEVNQDDHTKVMDALRTRDAERAATALAAHLHRSRDIRLQSFIAPVPGDEPVVARG